MLNLSGMNELMRQIEQMGRKVEGDIEKKALKEGANHLRDKIEENAPRRSGKLASEVIVGDIKDGNVQVGIDQQGEAFYGHFLEFGTKKMKAQPFMAPTLENESQTTQDKMSDVIKRDLGL
ncbi:HK97-gp10 family putative phage morphogenesis protein [Bacillus infantis]|uniref:HK97-gp10 family putative phage morphogenesis protein n=1 Tax=Bacillus infantis TaxID=324767 RepID=UPI003CEA38F9